MEELIPIKYGENGQATVSALLLYQFLECGRDFTTWIKERLKKYDFREGIDFSPVWGRSASNRATVDYELTTDTAKELSMVENNAKGRQARRYFLDCERRAKAQETTLVATSPAELILMLAQQNVANEARLSALENKVQELSAHTVTSDTDYFSIAGYASLHRLPLPGAVAQVYGKRAADLSRAQGVPIGAAHDARYGRVGTYHRDILKQVFNGTN